MKNEIREIVIFKWNIAKKQRKSGQKSSRKERKWENEKRGKAWKRQDSSRFDDAKLLLLLRGFRYARSLHELHIPVQRVGVVMGIDVGSGADVRMAHIPLGNVDGHAVLFAVRTEGVAEAIHG